MTTIWEAVGRFFGPSQNDRFAQLLAQLADTAVACASHFRETGGQDLPAIIDYEHRGDATISALKRNSCGSPGSTVMRTQCVSGQPKVSTRVKFSKSRLVFLL
jgi:hypothetical protein